MMGHAGVNMGVGGVGMMEGGGMGRGGVYSGPVMPSQRPPQQQAGFDMNSSVQSVMAVPNPSYFPMSSTGGVRQTAPPYDAQVHVHVSCLCIHDMTYVCTCI